MKILKNYIALSLSALVLGGCTSYPEQGTGVWLKVMILSTIKTQTSLLSCQTSLLGQNMDYVSIGNSLNCT